MVYRGLLNIKYRIFQSSRRSVQLKVKLAGGGGEENFFARKIDAFTWWDVSRKTGGLNITNLRTQQKPSMEMTLEIQYCR